MVAQPAIQDGLHAGFSDVQWVLDAYALTLASLLLTSGVLADRYGRKRLFRHRPDHVHPRARCCAV